MGVGVNSAGFSKDLFQPLEGSGSFDVWHGATTIENRALFYNKIGGMDIAFDFGILGDF